MKRASKARPAHHCCPIPSLRQVASMLAMGAGGTAFPQAAQADPATTADSPSSLAPAHCAVHSPPGWKLPAPPTSNSLTADERDAAKMLEVEAEHKKRASDFRTARDYLLRAYQLVRRPQLLANAANCAKAEGDWLFTEELAASVLSEHNEELGGEARAQLEELVREAQAQLARVTTVGVLSGDKIAVDGIDVGLAPLAGPICVNPGKHVLRFDRNGYEPKEQHVELHAGQALDVALPELRPLPYDPPRLPAGVPVPPPPPVPPKAGACGCGGGAGSHRPSQLASVALLAAALARRKRGSGNDR